MYVKRKDSGELCAMCRTMEKYMVIVFSECGNALCNRNGMHIPFRLEKESVNHKSKRSFHLGVSSNMALLATPIYVCCVYATALPARDSRAVPQRAFKTAFVEWK